MWRTVWPLSRTARAVSLLAARVVTGPLAFLLAGLIDVSAFALRALARRR